MSERSRPDPRVELEVLHAIAESALQGSARASEGATTPVEWAELAIATTTARYRVLALRRLAGKLLAHGVPGLLTEALLQCWNRCYCLPPLELEEVADEVRAVAAKHLQQRKPR